MFQRSMLALYDMMASRDSIVVKPSPVYPDVDPVFLQQFYKLTDAQRKTFYHELAGSVSLQTYNAMYNACFMKHAVERAHELQSALFAMTSSEVESVRKLVQDALWVPKDISEPPVPPPSSSNESAFRPIHVEAETTSIPAQESAPISAPSKAPETITTAITEPTNEIKIAEPTKPKTRKTSTKKVLGPESIIQAEL